jgi:hypothetical protein
MLERAGEEFPGTQDGVLFSFTLAPTFPLR